MKKILILFLAYVTICAGNYAQCSTSVYVTPDCNGEVGLFFTQNSTGPWHQVEIYADFGDTTTGFYDISLDTIFINHTYTSNGSYPAAFTLVYTDTMTFTPTCTTTVNETIVITSAGPPVINCNATFMPIQYCMDSVGFIPDFGPIPCGFSARFITALTQAYDTLSYLALPINYTPWPDSITIHYGYDDANLSNYLYCVTTVAIPSVSSYQLDLFADTLSLPSVTLHDTSSTGMYLRNVDWGDGNLYPDLFSPSYNHTYLIDGSYTIHADGIPQSMYSYYMNDSMSGTCVTYDSIMVNITGASTSLSCNLQPVVTYDLNTNELEFKLLSVGQLATSANLDASWTFNNSMTSTDDFGTIGSVNPGPTAFTVNYTIYDINHVQTCTASVTNSVNNIYPACNALVYIYEDSVTAGIFYADDQSTGGLPPYNYTWDYGDGNTSNLQYPPSHNYASPGVYMICLTITDSQTPPCSSTYCDTADARAFNPMSQFNVNNPTIGVETFEQLEFNLYPNPASDYIIINTQDNSGDDMNISVFNVAGQMLQTGKYPVGGNIILNVSDLSSGVYFIKLDDGKVSSTKKFIRQ